MKGNDGRAARRRITNRLVIGIGIFIIVVIFWFLWSVITKGEVPTRPMLRERGGGGGNAVNKAREFRKKMAHSYANEHDEAEMLEQILQAKIHLVDLEVVEDELLQSHPSTYAGVYGHFCQLNFAAHKKDPSSGKCVAVLKIDFFLLILLYV